MGPLADARMIVAMPARLLLALALACLAAASGALAATPSFPAPDCPAQLRPGATLSSSLMADATHTMKRYVAGGDTRGGEVGCGYYDPAKNYNYGWTLYYLFKSDTPKQVAQAVTDGFGPLGGWEHPSPSYCGVSAAVYAYVSCSPTTDADTVAAARAMLAAAESMAAPRKAAAPPPPAKPKATVRRITGDVAVSTDGGKTFAPLAPGAAIRQGDFVSTGFDSWAVLDFGYDTLTVSPATNLRIDEYTDANAIARTQSFLRVGSLRVQERHTNAIRSDFAVRTPTCNASVRDTDTAVSVAKDGTTKVFTVRDATSVRGLADSRATLVRAGFMVTVGAGKHVGKPVRYTAAALRRAIGSPPTS